MAPKRVSDAKHTRTRAFCVQSCSRRGERTNAAAQRSLLQNDLSCISETASLISASGRLQLGDSSSNSEETLIYDAVDSFDLGDALQYQQASLQLVAAADVLCYFGDLDNVVQAWTNALQPGGDLIFSCERLARTPSAKKATRWSNSLFLSLSLSLCFLQACVA